MDALADRRADRRPLRTVRLSAVGATGDAQRVMEIASGFLLDQVRLGRGPFDFIDALLVLGVTQANVQPVTADPALERAYASYDAPPPDDLRRPISINALAQSLGLSFETVRRRVSRLVLIGVLRSGPEGLWTPLRRLRSPWHRAVAEAAYGRMLALHAQLSALPEMQRLPYAEPWCGPPPLRAAARISSDYLLRFADLLTAELGDPLHAAIWLEVLRSNTVGVEPALSAGIRRPVRVAEVAKRLRLPIETTRRRAAHLVSRSACEHTPAGLLISEAILARPEFRSVAERNLADLRRMFERLARLGALPRTEGDRRAAA